MENDTIRNDNEELMEHPSTDLVERPQGRILRIKNGLKDVNFSEIIARITQCVDLVHISAHIEKATQYVVQVPIQYQKALNEGTLFINQNKTTGVMWPSLMEITEDGRWKFVANLPIVEKKFLNGNPIQGISLSFFNLALQKQITEIADTVKNIYETIKDIERGQMDDRIGLLLSGREQIQNAMLLSDQNTRRQEIALGRQNLYIAKNQIGLAFKRRVEKYKPIPRSKFAQKWEEYWHAGILSQRDEEFDELQDYYGLYLEVTKYLAASYLLTEEFAVARKVYEDSIDFMKTIDFRNVRTIQYIHNIKAIQNTFAFHPVAFIEAEKEDAEKESQKYDHIIIEASGEEILEAIENGKEIPKQETEQE